jgi:hypothetical protein
MATNRNSRTGERKGMTDDDKHLCIALVLIAAVVAGMVWIALKNGWQP